MDVSRNQNYLSIEILRIYRLCKQIQEEMQKGMKYDAEDLVTNTQRILDLMFDYMHTSLDLQACTSGDAISKTFEDTHNHLTSQQKQIQGFFQDFQSHLISLDESFSKPSILESG
jgi:hypothetical protein